MVESQAAAPRHRRGAGVLVELDQRVSLAGDRIMVTGSNGFIGSKVVEKLFEYGFTNLRCFIRPSSRLDRLQKALSDFDASKNVEFVKGDLLSRDDCRKAAEGVSIIYHLAAGMEKSFAGAFMNSALVNSQPELAGSNEFKSVMTPLRQMKACEALLAVAAEPTTVPLLFKAYAKLAVPPSVPRSCMVPF